MIRDAAAIAANRFGSGARPGELRALDDPRGWLRAQLSPRPLPAELADRPTTAALLTEAAAARDGTEPARQRFRRELRQRFREDLALRATVMVRTDAPFRERLVRFWTNHFAVSIAKGPLLVAVAAAYEREAIRPHATGRFEDLLLAVVRHPAMLVYLDQQRSIGPSSRAGKRREAGLNENLAREILELHTLGVDGGYDQADVEALAAILTGWSVARPDEAGANAGPGGEAGGGFQFRERAHEPGAKTLLGERIPEGGEDEGRTALRLLSLHPSTAKHVCTKLARHLVADRPPEALVERMTATWADSGGHLGHVLTTLIESDAAWDADHRKLKSPEDLVLSTARALGVDDGDKLVASMLALGQLPMQAPSPAGWPDDAESWAGPEAVLRRVEWAEQVADRVPGIDAVDRAEDVLGPRLSKKTRSRLRDAQGADAVALWLASPDFQWR